jgi:hypothetical protein
MLWFLVLQNAGLSKIIYWFILCCISTSFVCCCCSLYIDLSSGLKLRLKMQYLGYRGAFIILLLGPTCHRSNCSSMMVRALQSVFPSSKLGWSIWPIKIFFTWKSSWESNFIFFTTFKIARKALFFMAHNN